MFSIILFIINASILLEGSVQPAGYCESLPLSDRQHVAECEHVTIDDVCWSVTNYWPYVPYSTDGTEIVYDRYTHADVQRVLDMVADGEAVWVATPYNGQADGSPELTANGTRLHPDYAGLYVAGPLPIIGHMIEWDGGGVSNVADTFGLETYQNGVFWHDGWNQYVIGIDIFTPMPTYYLECGGTVLR